MQFLLSLVLAAFTLLAVSLLRTYKAIPVKELKRRARENDPIAQMLYRAASYGHSLQTLLWVLVGVTSALFFLYVSRSTDTWFAFISCVAVIWFGFLWLPAQQTSKLGSEIAARLAPIFAWPLQWLHPFLDWVARQARNVHPVKVHTGLYEKEDLVELIDKQEIQADNRIDKAGLEIARHALVFGDKIVRDILVPRRVVKAISSDETLSPVTMDELHKSGHSRFPVYEGKVDNIVGTLFLKDAINVKSGKPVKSVMRYEVYYVHEEQSLYDALQAILRTRHHLFIVVNSFEEYVGIITIEDVLEQIIGKPIIDEFDQYEDMRAVAARAAASEHKENEPVEAEKTETVESEVVE